MGEQKVGFRILNDLFGSVPVNTSISDLAINRVVIGIFDSWAIRLFRFDIDVANAVSLLAAAGPCAFNAKGMVPFHNSWLLRSQFVVRNIQFKLIIILNNFHFEYHTTNLIV